ncbi:MnhB domain-containing protein, partial [Escherichia coli]|uniref:MnhB domain-containing protein n=1 Tax=Escherichia coli TaxID=562 RepID=UPI00227F5CEB
WEAVGLVSYLLIGFWYTRPTAIFANMKAFLINRVGDFGFVLGIGLLFAGTAAVTAWLAYKPFLAALAWDIALPLVGHVHLSSVLLFDLGVYMLVVGSTVLVLVALAHQSLRAQRKAAAES